jgi:tRNA A37 threonylcarbamoyladenosine modification protein TsaB
MGPKHNPTAPESPARRSKILLIDSVHAQLFVALIETCGEDMIITSKTNDTQKAHDKYINRLVREVLAERGATFADISAYAVVAGPGSWTGCRVGVAAVKGFSFAAPRPVIELNSLDIIEAAASGIPKLKGRPAALKSNLDNYFIKRGRNYTCEKLSALSGFVTLDDVGAGQYRAELSRAAHKKFVEGKVTDARSITPFYITDFVVKN